MDPSVAVALVWSGVAVAILTFILGPSYVVGKVKRPLRESLKEVPELVYQLRAERARAAGTIATAQRRAARGGGGEAAPPEDGAEGELEIPPALLNIARGAGIDVDRLLAGDAAELAKAKTVLANATGQGSATPTGWSGYL